MTVFDDPKKAGIPPILQVQNRQPLSPEARAQFDALTAASVSSAGKSAAVLQAEAAADAKKAADAPTKRAVKRERKEAAAGGLTTALPPVGKEAASIIKRERRKRPDPNSPPAIAAVQPAPSGAQTEESVMVKRKTTKAAAGAKKPSTKKGAKVISDPIQKAVAPGAREGSKLALIVGLLTRKEGCTTKDVLDATGWPSVSMPQQVKAAGLKGFRKQKDGKVSRYFAALPAAA